MDNALMREKIISLLKNYGEGGLSTSRISNIIGFNYYHVLPLLQAMETIGIVKNRKWKGGQRWELTVNFQQQQ
jgi:predicted transcriptional regulator